MSQGKPKILTPNNLTFARLVLSVAVFVPLGLYNHGTSSPKLLDLAVVMFLVAGCTDLIDGYLARRYQMHTTLGRLLDPFVDKVLICGTFMFLAGPNFHDGTRSLTDLAPWMVVVVVAREFLVTSLRGFSESQGLAFAATVYGKVKMFLQSSTIVVIIISVAHYDYLWWAGYVRLAFIWPMVIFTVFSMLAYVSRYAKIAASIGNDSDGPGNDNPPQDLG